MRRTTTVALVATVLLVLLAAAAALADTIHGTDGNDTLTGTPGDDVMHGGNSSSPYGDNGADTFYGKDGNDREDALDIVSDGATPGKDHVRGGPGNDTIAANDGSPDDIFCGKGSRDIVYSDTGLDTVSDCEWRRSYDTAAVCPSRQPPWTGPPPDDLGGPHDWPTNVPYPSEKIIWCIDGTPGNDKNLVGTTDLGLLDSIWGNTGNDKLNGRLGADFLEGWKDNDILEGGDGSDFLFGDSSCNPNPDDCDYLNKGFEGAGADEIYGGPGNDFIGAIEGPDSKKDTIRCGDGYDVVQYDGGIDEVANDCEDKWESEAEDALYFLRSWGRGR
jgi:Ca2+-binding RTX toxin-like protein